MDDSLGRWIVVKMTERLGILKSRMGNDLVDCIEQCVPMRRSITSFCQCLHCAKVSIANSANANIPMYQCSGWGYPPDHLHLCLWLHSAVSSCSCPPSTMCPAVHVFLQRCVQLLVSSLSNVSSCSCLSSAVRPTAYVSSEQCVMRLVASSTNVAMRR